MTWAALFILILIDIFVVKMTNSLGAVMAVNACMLVVFGAFYYGEATSRIPDDCNTHVGHMEVIEYRGDAPPIIHDQRTIVSPNYPLKRRKEEGGNNAPRYE